MADENNLMIPVGDLNSQGIRFVRMVSDLESSVKMSCCDC